VFIVGSLEPDRASEVLFECEGCERHPAPSWSQGQSVASRTQDGARSNRHGAVAGQTSTSTDTDGVRTADGLARRLDDSIISFPSRYSRQPTKFNDQTDPLTIAAGAPAIMKVGASYDGLNQKLDPDGAHRTLRVGRDSSDFVVAPEGIGNDDLLPEGLDGHRYRCCGNGVVAPVAEWVGRRLVEVDRRRREEEG
jgi:hypothetical protein